METFQVYWTEIQYVENLKKVRCCEAFIDLREHFAQSTVMLCGEIFKEDKY